LFELVVQCELEDADVEDSVAQRDWRWLRRGPSWVCLRSGRKQSVPTTVRLESSFWSLVAPCLLLPTA